ICTEAAAWAGRAAAASPSAAWKKAERVAAPPPDAGVAVVLAGTLGQPAGRTVLMTRRLTWLTESVRAGLAVG
ncbi:hypothetical protein DBR41_26670, partial [Pseudomonas sp. HMWF010]